MCGLALLACAYVSLGCAHADRSAQSAQAPRSGEASLAPQALAERGLSLLARGDYVRAEQYLQLALRAGHPDQPLIVPLLQTCVASGRFRAALMHAERYLALHPRAWRVRYVKGAIHRALGQPEQARLELGQALNEAPAEAHRWLEPPPSAHAVHAARPQRTPGAPR